MKEEETQLAEKKNYSTPKLLEHGDIDTITLGNALGEDVDAAFTNNPRGTKQPKQSRFS